MPVNGRPGLGSGLVRQAPGAGSGYTRTVSLRRPISILVLAILAALPVSGAVCAMFCDSAAGASEHHSSASSCEESARPPSTDARIDGVAEHDCGTHDAALRQAPTTAAGRTDWGITSMPLGNTSARVTPQALTDSGQHFTYSAAPGTAPPTTTPPVLRV